MTRNYSINCDNGVKVDFITSNSIENMDVNMYRTVKDNSEVETYLLASIQIRNNEIVVDTFSSKASFEEVECHNIGLKRIHHIQNNPEELLDHLK